MGRLGFFDRLKAWRIIGKYPIQAFGELQSRSDVWKIAMVDGVQIHSSSDFPLKDWRGPFDLMVPVAGIGHVKFYGLKDRYEDSLLAIKANLEFYAR